jgi:hypothetical protein
MEKAIRFYWPVVLIGGMIGGVALLGISLWLLPWAIGLLVVGHNMVHLFNGWNNRNSERTSPDQFIQDTIKLFTENPRALQYLHLKPETPLTKTEWAGMLSSISRHFGQRVIWSQVGWILAGAFYLISRRRIILLRLSSQKFDGLFDPTWIEDSPPYTKAI